MILWLLGPTSSGKTTIASEFTRQLREKNIPIIHFDGDEVRDFFGPDLGFKNNDRLKVVKTLVYLANKSAASGINVIVSALTASSDARRYVDENMPNLIKVYVQCDISTCAERDPKGLYKMARAGEISTLIGYNTEYLPPEEPYILLNTNNASVLESVQSLLENVRGELDGFHS